MTSELSATTPLAEPAAATRHQRPRVEGKFVFVGERKFLVRGVTYGPFRPGPEGSEYHTPRAVARDFALMRAQGINAVRTYTVPPLWFFDLAAEQDLFVMVGLPWEQHIAFLQDESRPRAIEERVRAAVRSVAGHPAILCFTVGNEIPASIVRWHGSRKIERFIERLYRAVKQEDPEALVTYVNYPSTEYLQLPFLDLACFNVYLETPAALDAYLARLQNLADGKPLLMAEIGLDSRRHGEEMQAAVLDWQIRTVFSAGCGGMFVFSWTDEWHRGGADIDDWDFGLTGRDRRRKKALAAVRRAYADLPFPAGAAWPRISVVVCSHNGNRTIRDCLEGLLRLDYPDYEVIVVDDGSTDATAETAREYPFRLIRTPNGGLSRARNLGLEAATGEIVAYIDDDAYPDAHWLTYLAATFLSSDYAGVGGPNLPPPTDGPIADCVANAPGGPVHVLLSDREAEHIPGCNMAFRRSALQAIGGFDPDFRVAGDDVDVCWSLQAAGYTLGFSPAAVVWHHRRNSVRAYWRQQRGYGKAEALLEKKWPEKYNGAGQPTWTGRVYARGLRPWLGFGSRIYHGVWGTAPFQSLYEPASGSMSSLLLMPEWYLVLLLLSSLSALGTHWSPLLDLAPVFLLAAAATVARAYCLAASAVFPSAPAPGLRRCCLRGLTAVLHLIQPAARLWGRLRHGLTPSRLRGGPAGTLPHPGVFAIWSERWQPVEHRLQSLEAAVRAQGAVLVRGSHFDSWDLEVQCGGVLGAARLRAGIEEHGGGRQLLRFRIWPRCSRWAVIALVLLLGASVKAEMDQAALAWMLLVSLSLLLAVRTAEECAVAGSAVMAALRRLEREERRQFVKLPVQADRPVPEPVAARGR